MRAADALRIPHSGVLHSIVIAQLFGARFGQRCHVILGSEVQAAGGARLDASRLQPLAHAVGAQGALVNLLGARIELRNIKRTTRSTKLAPDAVLLLKINNAVLVLHNGAISRAGTQAARVSAVHALVFTHEPLQS